MAMHLDPNTERGGQLDRSAPTPKPRRRRSLPMRTRIIVAGLLCLLAPVCSPVAAQQLLFTAIDVQPAAINDMAETVGSFRTPGLTGDCFDPGTCSSAPTGVHGFRLDTDGSFRTLDARGATGSEAFGINAIGEIVGRFQDVRGIHGFLQTTDGGFTVIDAPAATRTEARAINATGQIVGVFTDASGTSHGFLLSGGAFTTIDVPGAMAG